MITLDYIRKNFPQLCDPTLRYDFELMYQVIGGIPQGDPDGGGARLLDDGRCTVTPPSIKRGARDFIEENYVDENGKSLAGYAIYVSRASSENGGSLKERSALAPSEAEGKAMFFDIRANGGVYLPKKDGKVLVCQILGPFQLGQGYSTEPVNQREMAITRIMAEDKGDRNKEREMGRTYVIDHCIIKHKGRYSGNIGKKAGMTTKDMEVLWTSMINGIEFRRSSMRGERTALSLSVQAFKDPFGYEKDGNPIVITLAEPSKP